MSDSLMIRVHYPHHSGAILLRSDRDWDVDVPPSAVADGGTRFDFEVAMNTPFLYFKPVLVRDGETYWAQGENLLALRDEPHRLEVYPHFFGDASCSVCTLNRFESDSGKRHHTLRVFNPPGYGENTLERYPVLYMQDGKNLFFREEAFGGEHWRVDETLRILTSMSLIRKAIVVGIYPEDRMIDYTQPGYESYGRYLVEEVKPWVDANYRTLTGPRETAVMGSSLGGVVSLYLAWQWPEVFGLAGCLSSTFTYRDDLMARIAREPKRPVKIYLDSGWPQDNYEVTRAMRNLLLRRGYSRGEDLLYLAFPKATHDEKAWSMRSHIPIQFFFPTDPARQAGRRPRPIIQTAE